MKFNIARLVLDSTVVFLPSKNKTGSTHAPSLLAWSDEWPFHALSIYSRRLQFLEK